MSKMCKLGSSCQTKPGMCGHEKMMTGLMIVIAAAAMLLWVF